MVHSPSWEANWFAASQEILLFHGTRTFITAFTSSRHLSLSWASSIQSLHPHSTFWRAVLILSFHLRLGLPSGIFPSRFPTKTLYTPLLSPHTCYNPIHHILLDFITRTILGEQYRSLSSSLCNFLHSTVTSSLSGPNILLNTVPSNTLKYPQSTFLPQCKRPIPVPKLIYDSFTTGYVFHSDELLASLPTPKLEDHTVSAVRDCLFNTFLANLHTGGRSSTRSMRTRLAVVTGSHLSRTSTDTLTKYSAQKASNSYMFRHMATILRKLQNKGI